MGVKSCTHTSILTHFVSWQLGCVLFERSRTSFAGLVGATVVTWNYYSVGLVVWTSFVFLNLGLILVYVFIIIFFYDFSIGIIWYGL